MRKPRHILFICCVALFLLHQLFQYGFRIELPLVDAYLDNLLAMPIILTLLLEERRRLFRKGPHYELSTAELIMTTLYISIISEILFPVLSPRFTFDILDFIFFFAGTAIYKFITIQEQAG